MITTHDANTIRKSGNKEKVNTDDAFPWFAAHFHSLSPCTEGQMANPRVDYCAHIAHKQPRGECVLMGPVPLAEPLPEKRRRHGRQHGGD